MAGNFNVQVELKVPEPNVFQVVIFPERLYLDGRAGSTITWTPVNGTLFLSTDDIDFMDAAGKFTKTFNTNGTITATVNGTDAITLSHMMASRPPLSDMSTNDHVI